MKIHCLIFLGVLGMAVGQLFGTGGQSSMPTMDPLAGMGMGTGGLDPTMGMGMGGLDPTMGMGGLNPMGGQQQQQGGAPDPMTMMLITHLVMADHSSMSMPVMSLLMKNPGLMKNPMGAVMIAKMLGADLSKIAGPLAMMNGGGSPMSMMRWLPLMNGEPNAMSMMMGMGGMGGMMGGMGGMMGGMGGMMGGMGGMGGMMGGMGGMMPLMAAAGM